MRLLHDNHADLATLLASSEDANYPATNLQLPQLSTRWRTAAGVKAATLAADAAARTASEVFFAARTNLIANAEDLTAAGWSSVGTCNVTLSDLYHDGHRLNLLTSTTNGAYRKRTVTFTGDAVKAFQVMIKKSASTADGRIKIRQTSGAAADKLTIIVDWTNIATPVAVTTGTLLRSWWIDSETVVVFAQTVAITAAETHELQITPSLAGQSSVYTSVAQAEDAAYHSPYIDLVTYPTLTRAAHGETVTVTMPDKWLFDIEVEPWFPWDTATSHRIAEWYVGATARMMIYYLGATDRFGFSWQDGGVDRFMQVAPAFSAVNNTVGKKIRLCGAVRVDTQAGQRFLSFLDGVKQAEVTTWDGVPDAKTSSFTSLRIAHENSTVYADSVIPRARFWNWDGVDPGTLDTEADIDAYLATVGDPIYEWNPAPRMSIDYAGLLGHNLTGNSPVIFEAWNDYAEGGLEYTRQTLYATPGNLVAALTTAGEYRHALLTLADPNQAADYLEAGRLFLGPYYQVSRGFAKEFTVARVRTDAQQFSPTGQLYGDIGVGYLLYRLNFNYWNRVARAAIEEMFEAVGKWNPFLAILDETDTAALPPLYCAIPEDISYTHRTGYIYKGALTLREVK